MSPSKSKKKESKLPAWVNRQRVQSVLVLALAILLLIQMVQLYRFRDRLAFIDTLEGRNSQVLQELDQGKEYLTNFGQDLNDIRTYLLLPTREYSFVDEATVELASEEEEDLTVQLFTYLEKLGEYEANQERYQANLSAWQNALNEPFWGENGLKVDSTGFYSDETVEFSFTDASETTVMLLKVALGYDGRFEVKTYDDTLSLSDDEDPASVLEDLQAYVVEELPVTRDQVLTVNAARTRLMGVVSAASFMDALASKGLSVSVELSSSEVYYYEVRNAESTPLLRVNLSKEDAALDLDLLAPVDGLSEKLDPDLTLDNVSTVLTDAVLNALDTRTELQKLVAQRDEEMQSVFEDRAFKAVMEELGLELGAREESDTRISYPILNAEAEVLRVLFLDKNTAEVKVELPDGVEVQTLSMAIQNLTLGKKKISTRLFI